MRFWRGAGQGNPALVYGLGYRPPGLRWSVATLSSAPWRQWCNPPSAIQQDSLAPRVALLCTPPVLTQASTCTRTAHTPALSYFIGSLGKLQSLRSPLHTLPSKKHHECSHSNQWELAGKQLARASLICLSLKRLLSFSPWPDTRRRNLG